MLGASPTGERGARMASESGARPSGTVIALNGETMGRGDEGLGAKLMGSFLRTLAAAEEKPDAIVFYNSAVKLLGPRSAHLEPLGALEDAGVDLLACVTCLEFHALLDQLALGQVSNMREIVLRTLGAGKVVTI
jgi:selenium metabolism protein YedF